MNMQHRFSKFEQLRTQRVLRAELRAERERARIAAGLERAAVRTRLDSPWIALRVWSGCEKAVEKYLVSADVEAIVPMRKGPELRRRHRLIEAPLLPVIAGYVLVRCSMESGALAAILSVDRAIGFVGGNAAPHLIPHKKVSEYSALAADGGFDWDTVRQASLPRLRIGSKVVIRSGPLDGFSGEIVSCRKDGKGDAVVLLDVFDNSTPVIAPLAMLEKL